MHKENLKIYQHPHLFHEVKKSNFNKVAVVVFITMITMVAEIIVGWLTGSMALLSDGWHMATHASALTITLGAYYFAHKHQKDTQYTFGTWKIEVLGAYTSAISLFFVGLMVIFASVERLFNPVTILYNQALVVAVIGLIINVVCALVIGHGNHDHTEHLHEEDIDHHSHGHDLNMKSAYFHVIADALTSIFAITALIIAKLFNLGFLDPFIGILSSILIFRWSYLLLRDTSSILLDKDNNQELIKKIKNSIENDDDSRIADIHLWRVGQDKYSCILSIVAHKPKTLNQYKADLQAIHGLAHISVEITTCPS